MRSRSAWRICAGLRRVRDSAPVRVAAPPDENDGLSAHTETCTDVKLEQRDAVDDQPEVAAEHSRRPAADDHALPLGASSDLPIGTDVAVLGYPLNQSFEALGFRGATRTLVQGVVAARQAYRPTPLSQPIPVLQIDANLGHSGGPVFLRSTGEVSASPTPPSKMYSLARPTSVSPPIDVARAAIAGE
ncbi:MAG: trypsin-like peptidase domain-containing protein [Armatimonadota bacterium]